MTGEGVLTVVQARMGSTRLPGKVMLPLAGRPALLLQLERLRASRLKGRLVVATTTDPADDVIERLARDNGFECFRGHPTDLLDRHVQAARACEARFVVKIPSDCPLIDPRVVDRVLGRFLSAPGRWDYVSNLHPPTHPDGNDVEIMTLEALETAWRNASAAFQREHTTPFLWDQPEWFRIGNVEWETGDDFSRTHRLTLDYPEDYEFLAAVCDALTRRGPLVPLEEIVALLERRPGLLRINARHAGVNWYWDHIEKLRTVPLHATRPPEFV